MRPKYAPKAAFNARNCPTNSNAKFARIPVFESMFVCTKFPVHPHQILEMYPQSTPLNQVSLMNSVDFYSYFPARKKSLRFRFLSAELSI